MRNWGRQFYKSRSVAYPTFSIPFPPANSPPKVVGNASLVPAPVPPCGALCAVLPPTFSCLVYRPLSLDILFIITSNRMAGSGPCDKRGTLRCPGCLCRGQHLSHNRQIAGAFQHALQTSPLPVTSVAG